MSEFGFGGKNYRFRPESDVYISLLSDGASPLLGILPADKTLNNICVVVSEGPNGQKTLKYVLKITNNGSNGIQYTSPEIPIPSEFRDLGLGELSREITTNIQANLKFIEENYPRGP